MVLLDTNNKMNKKNSHRNLLVMFKQETAHPKLIELELEHLHDILYHVEGIENYVKSHEIIDLNKYKVCNNSVEIKKFIREKRERAFVFINNKN